jgi:cellulose synthase/poly-beta-1,6-N-acetylglucosamine synthase-like glycosyltransferase
MVSCKIIFYGSILAIFYIYLGYPLVAYALSCIVKREVKKNFAEPPVSILISAYNESGNIEETISNKLSLDYPSHKLQIIVVSDGSTDGTDDIVRKYQARNVVLLRQEPRSGKTSALNLAVPCASGDILVFSDANSLYSGDALRKLMPNFHDPAVGYVTGKMVYVDHEGTLVGDGCSAYMRYENFLREIETRLGSVVGVDGGIDAVRKELFTPMKPDQLPDFVLPLKVVEQGYRVVYEPEAILRESSLKASGDEYRMRVRVSLRALWALNDIRQLFSLRKYRLFAWQLLSHKALRYGAFVFLLGAYIGNLLLWQEAVLYRICFLFQTAAYVGAGASPLADRRGHRLLYLLNYFVLLNAAAMHAFVKFLLRRKQVVWTPRKG